MLPVHSFLIYILLSVTHLVNASVTVYYQPGQAPLSTGTGTAAGALYTAAAAYDPTVLTPPAVPTNQPTQFTIQLQNGGTPNVSIPQSGAFVGFSIEMSVVNQISAYIIFAAFGVIRLLICFLIYSWKKLDIASGAFSKSDVEYHRTSR